MAILELVIAPDPRLEVCSAKVEKVDDVVRKLMDDMLETMYHYQGIGLAAVQVGVHKRILVMDIPNSENKRNPLFVINPEIVSVSEEQNIYEEGCLSFPDQHANVTRPKKVKVKYQDYNGVEKTEEFDGLAATCIQHEMDHLSGVVFIDHVSKMKHDMVIKKMQKLKKKLVK